MKKNDHRAFIEDDLLNAVINLLSFLRIKGDLPLFGQFVHLLVSVSHEVGTGISGKDP